MRYRQPRRDPDIGNTMKDMKPCPFCGKPAHIEYVSMCGFYASVEGGCDDKDCPGHLAVLIHEPNGETDPRIQARRIR